MNSEKHKVKNVSVEYNDNDIDNGDNNDKSSKKVTIKNAINAFFFSCT